MRPVVIVSLCTRNRHERANTVMVLPLTTSIHKDRQTGLQADSATRAEDITTIHKEVWLNRMVDSANSATAESAS